MMMANNALVQQQQKRPQQTTKCGVVDSGISKKTSLMIPRTTNRRRTSAENSSLRIRARYLQKLGVAKPREVVSIQENHENPKKLSSSSSNVSISSLFSTATTSSASSSSSSTICSSNHHIPEVEATDHHVDDGRSNNKVKTDEETRRTENRILKESDDDDVDNETLSTSTTTVSSSTLTSTSDNKVWFNTDVVTEIHTIPHRYQYSQNIRYNLWISKMEMYENVTRNSIEYANENYNWRNAVEEKDMFHCYGRLIHPAHIIQHPMLLGITSPPYHQEGEDKEWYNNNNNNEQEQQNYYEGNNYQNHYNNTLQRQFLKIMSVQQRSYLNS